MVYIGKSVAITQNGEVKNLLQGAGPNNEQEKVKGQLFLDMKMQKENIDGLDIYWFITMNKKNNDLPGYVEGLLIQRFFETYDRLPEWNNEY